MRGRVLIVVAMLVGSALAASAVAVAAQGTSARIYKAFKSNGKPAIHVTNTVSGSCNGGSAAANRSDAWRCFSGNFVYDPCFSSSKASGFVLCVPHAWQRSGVKMKLTSKLPSKLGDKPKPSTAGTPWAIKTTTGLKCSLATGATTVVDGRRANYFCTNGVFLWGTPSRKSQPWTIFIAKGTAKTLTKKVKVRVAWF